MNNHTLGYLPALGWNSWNTFTWDIDETLIKEIADCFVEKGYKDAGYEYIVIDDCWSLRERDKDGNLVADPKKFPHGMKAVADYIHAKGLKFGMYSCAGTHTCAGYPGSFEHEFQDAATFAGWDVDYLMMKQVYASGVLGDVFGVESRYQGSRGIPGDWRGHKEHGGGMLYDWGIHLIDQMLGIVYDRRIESIFCRCEHITNDEVDDGFKLDLYFEGGLDARIEVGTSHFISLPRFYMTGRRGTAEVNDWRDRTRIVTCREWHEDDVKPVVTSAGLTKTMAPRDEKTVDESWVERPESDVHDFYRNFTRAIDGKEPQLVTHAQMRRDLRIIEAAFESDKEGRIIPFDDTIN